MKTAFSLAISLLFGAAANAVSVAYNIQFNTSAAGFGSGTMTFVDTPSGPSGGLVPGGAHYDFVDVAGSGPLGTWVSSFFEYDPATGLSRWAITAGTAQFVSSRIVPVDLSPVAAVKANLVSAPLFFTGSLKAEALPETGSTLPLAAAGFLALLLARGLIAPRDSRTEVPSRQSVESPSSTSV